MSSTDQSFRSLISQLIGEVTQLTRQELRLAQTEMSEKIDQAQTGAISVLGGLLVGFVALIVLAQALVIALSNVVEPWLAAVIVGVALAFIGFVMVKAGQKNLKPSHLTPQRTIRSVRRDSDMVMERTP